MVPDQRERDEEQKAIKQEEDSESRDEESRKRKYDGWVPTAYGYVREKKDIVSCLK